MIKIIGGGAKGRSLKTLPTGSFARPILARIKKSLFDILKPRIVGSRFLDLYAGTGAVGLEALSRGAEMACFVDSDINCINLIKANVDQFSFTKKSHVVQANVLGNLSFLPKPFNLIFMGPPYKDMEKKPLQLVHPTLTSIYENKLLSAEGIVIAQHHKKEFVTSNEFWSVFREESYGDSVISFLKPAGKN